VAPRTEIIAFMYHEVTDEPAASGFQRPSAMVYKHPLREFEANLDQIAASGKIPERVDSMLHAHTHLLLTFDDGGKSALVAADLLEKRGWRGHFFVITSFIDTPGFVTKSDVRELHARGHLIGSHSHTHPDVFRAISYSQMQYEWTYSRECLADILGEPVAAAAIPGGHGNYLTERAAASAGYRFLFTSIPRKVPWITDCMLCIGRVCAKKGTPVTRISALAHGRGFTQQMCVWRMKSAARALCSSVSLVTADQGRHYTTLFDRAYTILEAALAIWGRLNPSVPVPNVSCPPRARGENRRHLLAEPRQRLDYCIASSSERVSGRYK
jgi:peptidoglycan/xylan/chitin deacetylase (PgdA/CDA1 family)